MKLEFEDREITLQQTGKESETAGQAGVGTSMKKRTNEYNNIDLKSEDEDREFTPLQMGKVSEAAGKTGVGTFMREGKNI